MTDDSVVTSTTTSEGSNSVTWADSKQTAMTENFKRTTAYETLNADEKSLVNALIEAQEEQGDMSAL